MTMPAARLGTTRASYDTVAADYAELLAAELDKKPLDRAMLAAFAEVVRAAGAGPVADVGCGPGRVTAHLTGLGVTAFGVDLSPGMIEVARRRHPDLEFGVGSMTALDIEDGTLGGVLAWYSTCHTPLEQLPSAYAEFHRVLAPGGHLLTAFKVGGEQVHLDRAYGHEVDLDVYRHGPDEVAALLTKAGFVVTGRLTREADVDGSYRESTAQAFIMATRSDIPLAPRPTR
ncbi:class I SAM-dependent DNA methyltransferase [Streptomyces sp. NPDC058001]|uniref:class I SAM-dependent DNA methyltransferase n=1 Tax=Streptomyces sp. NPDC058001 TaxID=3346300 RepID=UPI0036E06A2C